MQIRNLTLMLIQVHNQISTKNKAKIMLSLSKNSQFWFVTNNNNNAIAYLHKKGKTVKVNAKISKNYIN